MKKLNVINDGFIEIKDGIITNLGNMKDWNGIEDWNNIEIIDAEGGSVFHHTVTVHSSSIAETEKKNL